MGGRNEGGGEGMERRTGVGVPVVVVVWAGLFAEEFLVDDFFELDHCCAKRRGTVRGECDDWWCRWRRVRWAAMRCRGLRAVGAPNFCCTDLVDVKDVGADGCFAEG